MGADTDDAIVLERSAHNLSRRGISRGALKVLYRLDRAGYDACLVGGGVRDLLLGKSPKDFDVATDARPEQVRRLFRNSRIIGRRFRLVHVLFQGEMVEVSTYRARPDPRFQRGGPGELLVTNDNTYGTPREDAFRRDFTVNALYYHISDYSVVDYVGGLEDLEYQLIQVIGDPELRFQEDPVRMLRACEFAGRLDFDLELSTADAIRSQTSEILKASPARLTEELLQLLSSGAAQPTFEWALEVGLLQVILPEVSRVLEDGGDEPGVFSGLFGVLDRWVAEQRVLSDHLLLAIPLAVGLIEERQQLESRANPDQQILAGIVERAIARLAERFALSNARRFEMFAILETFQRLCEEPPSRKAQRDGIASRIAFADALKLFELICDATGGGHDALQAWREISKSAPAPPKRRRRPARRRRPRRRRRR